MLIVTFPWVIIKKLNSYTSRNLAVVDKFTILGSALSRSARIDDEVNNRTAKASTTFGRLKKQVWERRGI